MQIHKIKTLYSNTYVVEEDGSMFVVDVAMRYDGFVLKHIQEDLGLSIDKIELVVCTNDDPDHIGGVIALARSCRAISAIPYASKRPSLKLYENPLGPVVRIATTMREAFRERSRRMYLNPERHSRYQHIHNHHLDEAAQRYVLPQQRLTDGKRLQGFPNWEVVHTPGHSWDSICFFHRPSRSLVSGDTLLGSGSKGHLVHPAIYDNPLDIRRTLKKLQRLNPKTVYPGHGLVFSGSEILDHL
jgi:glyoxylase-like metal-dependent hydrolase (beta-lactamase superfamily II)